MNRHLICVLTLVAFCSFSNLAQQSFGQAKPSAWAKSNLSSLQEVYRHLHSNPEISFLEEKTAAYLAAKWKKSGFEVTEKVGGHGIVGVLKNGDGPTLMLRTDLDALPVLEQTGLEFASTKTMKDQKGKIVPVMHACGHDVHMTSLTGTLAYLAEHRDSWKGTIVAIGQPAEERGMGATAMLNDGLFRRFPRPNFAVALHVDSFLAAGKVSVRKGYTMANVDSVDVTMLGKGGHGAAPHTTVDPIVQAAEFVVSVQQIVSREIKPIEPAVITVGSIHGGFKHNIIGNECHLQLTVRSYSDSVRKQLLDGIKRKAKAVAIGARAPEPKITVSEGTPSLYNNDLLTERLTTVFRKTIGKDNVVFAEPVMGGEDFSQYGRAGVPILMYRLGAVSKKKLAEYKDAGQIPASLHSPKFYPDDLETTLMTGVSTMASAALEILKSK